MTSRARFPDRARSHAVLIGTATYQDSSLPGLPAVARNLTGLAAVLTNPHLGGWPENRVTVIRDPVTVLEVGSKLVSITEHTQDTLLVYYAGHGLLTPRGELHLSVGQTIPSRLQFSGLPFDSVRDALRGSPAVNRILILDCCFSGRVIDFMGDPANFVADVAEVAGTYTLTATSGNGLAGALSGQTYTAFTGQLLDLLRAGIPDGPAELTLGEIYPHLQQRLRVRNLPRPEQRGTGNIAQLALVRNAARSEPSSDGPEPVPGPSRLRRWLRQWFPHGRHARIFTLTLVIVLLTTALIAIGTRNVTDERSPTLNRITELGFVTVGVLSDQRGLSYRNPATGEYEGFDIKISRLIADKLGFDQAENIHYIDVDSKNREQAIMNGVVDYYVSAYGIRDDRKEKISFAGPYFLSRKRLLVRADENSITDLGALEGKRVCLVGGDAPKDIKNLQEKDLVGPFVEAQNYSDCVDQLLAGRVDVVTTDDAKLQFYVAQYPDRLKFVGEPFSGTSYGVGLSHGDTVLCERINDILETAAQDGTWRQIYASTLGSPVLGDNPPPVEPC